MFSALRPVPTPAQGRAQRFSFGLGLPTEWSSGTRPLLLPTAHRFAGPEDTGGSWLPAPSSGAARAILMGASVGSVLPAMVGVVHAAPAEVARPQGRSIVMLGMNPGSRHEATELRATVGPDAVTFLGLTAQDRITVNGATYDLATEAGRTGFVATLSLRPDTARALTEVLAKTSDKAKDEMAQLAQVFAQAEKGQRTLSRLLVSGHSLGSAVWGDDNGWVQFDGLAKLLLLFPRAAGQVEHLMFSACYTGGESNVAVIRQMFPNLKSLWAYDGSSPGSYSGAVPHIRRWEAGTRTGSTPTRDAVRGIRKGEFVAVWTAARGYDNGSVVATPLVSDRNAYQL